MKEAVSDLIKMLRTDDAVDQRYDATGNRIQRPFGNFTGVNEGMTIGEPWYSQHRIDAQLTAKYWLLRHHPELNFEELLEKYPNCISSIGNHLTLILKDGEAEKHNLYDFFWHYGRDPEDANEDGKFTEGFVWLERFYTGAA